MFAHEVQGQAETLRNGPARSPTDQTQQLYFERRGLLQQLADSPSAPVQPKDSLQDGQVRTLADECASAKGAGCRQTVVKSREAK